MIRSRRRRLVQRTWDDGPWDVGTYDSNTPASGLLGLNRMQKVKLSLSERSGPALVDFALSHGEAMDGNIELFPAPDPPKVDYTALVTAFQSASAAQLVARQQAKERTQEKLAARLALEEALRARGGYVDKIANGDATVINAAAFDATAVPSPAPRPAAPTSLTAVPGDVVNSLRLRWKRTPMINSYVIEMCVDPLADEKFTHVGVVTRTSHTVLGLTPGLKYWFRVAAVGAAGQSLWSNLAVHIVI